MKKIYFFLFFIYFVSAYKAQNIRTVIGGVGSGFSGDGGPATSAELSLMQGPIVKDNSGNIYFADMENNRVRKVSFATGIITTIAGSGIAGYNGDTIPATTAQLNWPSCVAIDTAGNIFIGEYSGCRIRKIDKATGLIYTITGDGTYGYSGDNILASASKTKEIGGLLLDSLGNIYFSDMGNAIIRKITVATGKVNTIAGTAGTTGFAGDGGPATSAQFWTPYGIARDNAWNIYVADMSNNRIRKIDKATGNISTVAGTNVQGYNGDGILATNAQLDECWGVAVDKTGNIFIADANNYRVRKVDVTSGIITTYAGNGGNNSNGDGGPATSAQIGRPFGIMVDNCETVYITPYGGTYAIREISPFNVSTTPLSTSCHGMCNGNISSGATGGSGPYTYSWSGGLGNTANVGTVCAGTYTVIVNDINGCKSYGYATVNEPALISAGINSVHYASCINDGSATVSVSGGIAPYAYSWSSVPIQTTAVATNLPAGNYSVTVSDSNNCVNTQTVTITANNVVVTFNETRPTCHANGSVSANVTGGNGPYTYTWSTGSNSSSVSSVAAGNYTLTATDTNGCTGTGIEVLVNDSVVFSSVPICMVTVDSASQHNIIIWDKTSFTNADSFIVYREITTNNYKRINAQPYSSLSMFIDTVRTLYFPNTGDPNAGTYRYKIATRDTCNMYSDLSPYHNTLYFLNNSGTFYWTQPYTIEGSPNPVSSYILERDDNSTGAWHAVSSVAGTQQTISDPLYAAFQNTATWRVKTQWSISCTPTLRTANGTANNFSASISNIFRNAGVGVNMVSNSNSFNVIPNPSNGNFVIETTESKNSKVEVYSLLGDLVYKSTLQKEKTNINLQNVNKGTYLVHVISDSGTTVKRIIVE